VRHPLSELGSTKPPLSAIDRPNKSAERRSELDVLSEAAAVSIASRVRDLSPLWTWRSPLVPFATLGAALYLDAPRGLATYIERARQTSQTMRSTFGDLYAALCSALSRELGQPVTLAQALAPPGFHIYEADPTFTLPVASLHWDRQHDLIPWRPGTAPGPGDVLSVTLPIVLPESGSGLELWRHYWTDDRQRRDAILADPGPAPELVEYRVGTALLHDGLLLHRAKLACGAPGARLTLQAHLVRRGDGWRAYW